MSIVDSIRIHHGIDKDGKYYFEKFAAEEEFDTELWSKEQAYNIINKTLGLSVGPETTDRCSVIGDPYIIIVGNNIKAEGEIIEGWQETPDDAWNVFLRAVKDYASVFSSKAKIYWREYPELLKLEGKFAVAARLLVSDKEI